MKELRKSDNSLRYPPAAIPTGPIPTGPKSRITAIPPIITAAVPLLEKTRAVGYESTKGDHPQLETPTAASISPIDTSKYATAESARIVSQPLPMEIPSTPANSEMIIPSGTSTDGLAYVSDSY